MKDRITNTITRHIGVISESSRGWKLELNKQMEQTIVKAMEFYNKHMERQRNDRDAR